MSKEKKKNTTPMDAEVLAISRIMRILAKWPQPARSRIMAYVSLRANEQETPAALYASVDGSIGGKRIASLED